MSADTPCPFSTPQTAGASREHPMRTVRIRAGRRSRPAAGSRQHKLRNH